jgi:hypothetical protein
MKIVYEYFSNKKCLIVLDNVELDEFNVLKVLPMRLRPNWKKPALLITSRCISWENGIKVLNLDVLKEDEAIKFVKECVYQAEEIEEIEMESMKDLVRVLGRLPLALQQAIAYIRTELKLHHPILTYLNRFEVASKHLLEYMKHCPSAVEKSTLVTWTVTMKRIKTKEFGELAIEIMDILSCFEPDNIPYAVFASLEAAGDERSLKAITLLAEYSLINLDRTVKLIHVHRLVQHVVRITNKENERIGKTLSNSIDLLDKFMHKDFKDWPLIKCILPHAESVWRHVITTHREAEVVENSVAFR